MWIPACTRRAGGASRPATFDFDSKQKAFFWPLFGVRFEFVCPKKQFVLSSFFDVFDDSKGLIEFVPAILTFFCTFAGSSVLWAVAQFDAVAASSSVSRRTKWRRPDQIGTRSAASTSDRTTTVLCGPRASLLPVMKMTPLFAGGGGRG
jgi:hypothetical protein